MRNAINELHFRRVCDPCTKLALKGHGRMICRMSCCARVMANLIVGGLVHIPNEARFKVLSHREAREGQSREYLLV